MDKSCDAGEISELIKAANAVSVSSVSELAARYGVRLPDTDEEGIASVNDLSQGIYLVAETKIPDGHIPCDPFCVALPQTNISEMSIGNIKYGPGEIWLYDISVYPKSRSVSDKRRLLSRKRTKKARQSEKNMRTV